MPIYTYFCDECRKEYDVLQPISNKHSYKCEKCGTQTRRVFTAPATFRMDFTPGWDVGLGQYVDTKRQRENIMAEKGLARIKD